MQRQTVTHPNYLFPPNFNFGLIVTGTGGKKKRNLPNLPKEGKLKENISERTLFVGGHDMGKELNVED